MSNMLPALQSHRLSLADVMPSCLSALAGPEGVLSGAARGAEPPARPQNRFSLPFVDRAVVVLIDGLGAQALRQRAGHARFLAPKLNKHTTLFSGFPTTTVAGIASLTTGVSSGTHGLVAYRVFDAANDRIVNQLSGWDDQMRPSDWQTCETAFEIAEANDIESYAVGPARYRESGYTLAALRGAKYVPAKSIEGRFAEARRVLDGGGKKLVYLYVPELDVTAHAKGSESERWFDQLEQLDSELSKFAATLGKREGAIVTADHGVLDVPETSHVLFAEEASLVAGVRHIGGDPRFLHLYLEPDASASDLALLKAAWLEQEGSRSWIATREEAIEAGWFGPVDPTVLPRIGDLLVAARKRIAYYDPRPEDQSARSMVGQHGSLTDDETLVPLIRLGSFVD